MNDKNRFKIYDNFPALSPDETEIVLTRFTNEREWQIYSDNPTYARKYDALLDTTKPTSKGYRDGALVMIDGYLDSDLCTVSVSKKHQYTEEQRLKVTADMNDEIGTLNFEGAHIDVHVIDGKLLFNGKGVAETLGYSEPLKALHDHVAMEYEWATPGGIWLYHLIDEEGLDSLIANANQSERRRKFKNWIEWEIFPAIRINSSAEEKMSKEDYIGLAWVSTGSDIVRHLCEFPPFELAVAKDVKVVIDGLNGQEIGKVIDCRTVAKDYDGYYANMIMNDAKPYGKIIGTVNEFEGA